MLYHSIKDTRFVGVKNVNEKFIFCNRANICIENSLRKVFIFHFFFANRELFVLFFSSFNSILCNSRKLAVQLKQMRKLTFFLFYSIAISISSVCKCCKCLNIIAFLFEFHGFSDIKCDYLTCNFS